MIHEKDADARAGSIALIGVVYPGRPSYCFWIDRALLDSLRLVPPLRLLARNAGTPFVNSIVHAVLYNQTNLIRARGTKEREETTQKLSRISASTKVAR